MKLPAMPSLYENAIEVHINNPLPDKLFLSFFGTYPKIGSFCLPTHSRDAHRKFFDK